MRSTERKNQRANSICIPLSGYLRGSSSHTPIQTNLLFFDTSCQTQGVWFYEHEVPLERRHLRNPCYTGTVSLHFDELLPIIEWWDNRASPTTLGMFPSLHGAVVTQDFPLFDVDTSQVDSALMVLLVTEQCCCQDSGIDTSLCKGATSAAHTVVIVLRYPKCNEVLQTGLGRQRRSCSG